MLLKLALSKAGSPACVQLQWAAAIEETHGHVVHPTALAACLHWLLLLLAQLPAGQINGILWHCIREHQANRHEHQRSWKDTAQLILS